jgi:uncharacterized protein (TIGR02300 family)
MEISVSALGTRYKCYKCNTKFYDLNKIQPLCPSCGEDQNNNKSKMKTQKKNRRTFSREHADMSIRVREEDKDLIEVDKRAEGEDASGLDMDEVALEENSDTEGTE